MSQTERILFIDRKLRSCGNFTVKEVADYFEVSERQVKRDIEYMRDRFEAPIEWNFKEKKYIYASSFERLKFADQHLILAYLSMQSMLKNANYFPAVSSELLQNLKSQIPKDYLKVCGRILYEIPAAESLEPEIFTGICGAMRDLLCLELVYTNTKNELSERIFEPCNLINYGGNWYVVGFDYLRNEIRTFNVARIKKLSLTKKSFEKHGDDFEQKLKNYIENGFGIFLGEKTENVKIRFYGKAVQIVKTQKWHPKQVMSENFGGEGGKEDFLELNFPAADMTEVLSKILSFGKNAVPLESQNLVDLWKAEIRKMCEIAGVYR